MPAATFPEVCRLIQVSLFTATINSEVMSGLNEVSGPLINIWLIWSGVRGQDEQGRRKKRNSVNRGNDIHSQVQEFLLFFLYIMIWNKTVRMWSRRRRSALVEEISRCPLHGMFRVPIQDFFVNLFFYLQPPPKNWFFVLTHNPLPKNTEFAFQAQYFHSRCSKKGVLVFLKSGTSSVWQTSLFV